MSEHKSLIQKVVWIYLAAFALVAFSFHSVAKSAEPEAATAPAVAADAPAAAPTKKSMDTKKSGKKAAKKDKKGKDMFAEVETNMGNFKIKFYSDKAPKTVENFVGLAEGTKEWTDPKTHQKVKRPYYDGLTFHRIIPNFMIQGGDPEGNGRGGPGYKFDNETPKELTHKKGAVSMANAGPNTNGSQFFIVNADLPKQQLMMLDGNYSIFGEVVDGMDTIEKISHVRTGPQDRPVEPVVMKKVTIVRQ